MVKVGRRGTHWRFGRGHPLPSKPQGHGAYLVSYRRGKIWVLGTLAHPHTDEALFDLRQDRIDSYMFGKYKQGY